MEQWHGKVVRITRDPLDDALAHCRAVMARGSVDASYAYPHQASHCDPHATRPDSPGARPEPYDPAGDSDSDSGSLNAGLDRLGDHHQGPGGFGRVDRAQSMDRARRDVPPDGREPVRDPRREAAVTTVSVDRDEIKEIGLAADAMTREAQERGEYDSPLSSIPDLIEMIRRERDEARADNARLRRHLTDALGDADRHEANHTLAVSTMQAWKARAESAERRLAERASCCIKNEERLRVRDARVEPPPDTVTPVLLHVAMGMGQTWVPVTLANDGFECRWFSLATTRVYLMDESPCWLPMPPPPEGKR